MCTFHGFNTGDKERHIGLCFCTHLYRFPMTHCHRQCVSYYKGDDFRSSNIPKTQFLDQWMILCSYDPMKLTKSSLFFQNLAYIYYISVWKGQELKRLEKCFDLCHEQKSNGLWKLICVFEILLAKTRQKKNVSSFRIHKFINISVIF